ncbi:MAG: hypothetical protein MUD01_22380, partial [Chloroflexaceae bacterium]|nr:hypothetical protein [Chloroflexaceae bacterium]
MPNPLLRRLSAPLLLFCMLALVLAGSASLRLAPATFSSPGGPLRVVLSAAPSATAVRLADQSGPRAAFAALQARTSEPLSVTWDATTGIPTYLAGAAVATRLPYTPTAAERGNPLAIARGFLDANRALFGLRSAASELQLRRNEADHQLGYSHMRLDQVYQGIPVFGKQLVVHLDQQEQVVAVNGQFLPQLDVPTQPTISQRQAEEAALRDLHEVQLEPDEQASVVARVLPKTALTIYVDEQQKATLTWRVTILTEQPWGEWSYFVNGRRATVVHAFDKLANAKQRYTYSANRSTNLPGRLLIEEGQRSSRDEIAQTAHDAAGRVYDYFSNTFQRDSIDNNGMPLVSTVHYGSDPTDAENAAWV